MQSVCLFCHQEFDFTHSQQHGKYCSNQCCASHKRALIVEGGLAKSSRPLRRYLIERGSYECVRCGNNGSWLGEPLALQLDHIDGDSKNNVLENVQWLCPNCHSQTDTWGSQNIADENRDKLRTKGL